MKLQKRLEIAGFRRKVVKSGAYAPVPVKEHPETWTRDNVRIVLRPDMNTVYTEVRFNSSYPPEVREEDMSDEMLMEWLNEYCPLPTFDELLKDVVLETAVNLSRVDFVTYYRGGIEINMGDTKISNAAEDWQAEILLDGFRKLFKPQPHE